jgi:hemoglobin/transferrin/lactoferrin receptor protein
MLYSQYQATRKHQDLAVDERNKDEIYAKDEDGNNYAPGWYTLNTKFQYQFNNNLIISGGIENMTDQRYRPYSSGISGPGINFVASIAYKFP